MLRLFAFYRFTRGSMAHRYWPMTHVIFPDLLTHLTHDPLTHYSSAVYTICWPCESAYPTHTPLHYWRTSHCSNCMSPHSALQGARSEVVNWCVSHPISYVLCSLNPYGQIETAEQRTTIQQYGDWYTDRWWVCCYIWYSDERPGRDRSPPSSTRAVPNVTAHPSTASVPTSYHSIWHYNCLCALKG